MATNDTDEPQSGVISAGTVASLRASYFLVTLASLVWVPRIPEIKDALALSNGQLGRTLMTGGSAALFFSGRIGTLVVKHGSFRTFTWYIPIAFTSALLIGSATNLITLIIGLIVGSFAGIIIFTAVTTQANTFSHITSSNSLNNLTAVSNIGSLSAVVIGSGLLTHLTRAQYIIGMNVLLAIGFMIARRGLLTWDYHENSENAGVTLPWFSRAVVPMYVLTGAMMCSTVAEFSANDWSAIFTRDELGVGAPQYLIPFVFFQIGIVLIRFAANRLSGTLGVGRFVQLFAGSMALIWAFCIFAASHIPNGHGALVLATIGFFAAGLGIGPVYPALMNAVVLPGVPKPLVLARLFSLVVAAFVFGPGIMGSFAQTFGLDRAILLPPILLGIVGLLAMKVLASESVSSSQDMVKP